MSSEQLQAVAPVKAVGLKMAKADREDIDAASNAMSVLSDISSGYYPARGEENAPTFFDEEDPGHLRRFYDLMQGTLDKSPGWPGRVIGGMCYVILYDENQIVDPAADVLDLHPRFAAVAQQRDDLLKVAEDFNEVLAERGLFCECGRADCRTTRLRAAIAKVKGPAVQRLPANDTEGGEA